MTITTMSPPDQDVDPVPEKKSRKKRFIALALVFVMVTAAWFFLLRPSEPTAAAAPEPGEVVALEPIQVNLTAGHYLRIGVALQTSADAEAELDGSKALDATIALFSGQPMEKLTNASERQKYKTKLVHTLKEKYEGEVIGVYFTDFVTQ